MRLLRRHLGPTPNQDSNRILLSLLLVPSTGLALLGNLTFADVAAAVQTFDRSSQDDLKEGDHQTGDQPDVDHLHVRGGGQLLYLAGEDGGHHQHDGQVHSNVISKEVFVKEGGGEADEEEEDGGEVGGQQLCGNLPLQLYSHRYHVSVLLFGQIQFCYGEHSQVLVLIRQIPESFWLTRLVGH